MRETHTHTQRPCNSRLNMNRDVYFVPLQIISTLQSWCGEHFLLYFMLDYCHFFIVYFVFLLKLPFNLFNSLGNMIRLTSKIMIWCMERIWYMEWIWCMEWMCVKVRYIVWRNQFTTVWKMTRVFLIIWQSYCVH